VNMEEIDRHMRRSDAPSMVRRRHDEVILDPQELDLPEKPRVLEIRAEPYVDSTGDDALEVWVVTDDSATSEELDYDHVKPIEDRIRQALWSQGDERIAYFWIRRKKEMRRRRPW